MPEEDKLKKMEGFSHKNFRFFEGKIEGFDERFCIFKGTQLKAYYDSLLEHLNEGREALLEKVGKDYGMNTFQELNDEIPDEKSRFEYMLTELNKLGWGKFWNVKPEAEAITLEYQNPMEDFDDQEIHDYYVMGVLTGMAQAMLKEEIKVLKEERTQRGALITYKLKFVKRKEFNQSWAVFPVLKEILDAFDTKAKTNFSMIVSASGEIMVKNNTASIDHAKFSAIASTIVGGTLQVSPMGVGNFMQLALMYDDGVIMAACPENKKMFIVGALNKQASVNLIGIALKQACEKLEKVEL